MQNKILCKACKQLKPPQYVVGDGICFKCRRQWSHEKQYRELLKRYMVFKHGYKKGDRYLPRNLYPLSRDEYLAELKILDAKRDAQRKRRAVTRRRRLVGGDAYRAGIEAQLKIVHGRAEAAVVRQQIKLKYKAGGVQAQLDYALMWRGMVMKARREVRRLFGSTYPNEKIPMPKRRQDPLWAAWIPWRDWKVLSLAYEALPKTLGAHMNTPHNLRYQDVSAAGDVMSTVPFAARIGMPKSEVFGGTGE